MALAIPARTRAQILELLENLPRPKYLAGKVTLSLEFNCRPDGTLGDVQSEIQVRESLGKTN